MPFALWGLSFPASKAQGEERTIRMFKGIQGQTVPDLLRIILRFRVWWRRN